MKRAVSAAILAMITLPQAGWAQTGEPTGQKTLAATVGVYAFPSKGQDASQQSQDEAACYQGAVKQTGVDPFQVEKQAEAQAQQNAAAQQQAAQAGKGAGAAGAAKGAAAGAVIGEVASDDAGKGAAIGAAAGAVAGRRKKKQAQAQAQQQVEQQAQAQAQASEGQITAFKKSFAACLESKNYVVKY